MRTVEGQNKVKEAFRDLETVVLCQAIQEIETQLAEDLKKYQSMKDERKHIKHTLLLQRKPMKSTLLPQMKQKLEELQRKYAQLYA